MTIKAELYDANNINELDWPETTDGQYAKAFLGPLVKNRISYYIQNVQAEIYVLKYRDLIFPILDVNESHTNSWVCSPYAHYFILGKEFSGIVGNRYLSLMAKEFLNIFGKICRSGKINSVVYVNNWLFSTDLYPEGITSEHVDAILNLLTKRFPEHAIMMRSLNKITTPSLLESVQKHNFHLIASRYVYVTDTLKDSIFKTRILKSDLKLWNQASYQILKDDEVQLNDCQEFLNLHQKLYVIQHSPWQPQYNLFYFRHLFENQLLKFKVFKTDGVIKGVAGYYKRGKIMMCPIFGYQKDCPDSNPTYRILNTALLLEAQKEGLLFNQSAGASFFKSIRRAEGCLEYMAVYTRHLSFHRQLMWATLQLFMNKFGSRYMQNYK
jgi:hypothetical protein